MSSDMRQLVAEVKANGFEVVQGRTHLAVRRDGKRIATLSVSPSGRAVANQRAMLKRLGVIGGKSQ